MQPNRTLVTAVCAIELVAFAIWLGGLSVLGAIVAPTIFGAVPNAADAMTLVFQKFDRIAMTSAVVVLLCEATLTVRGGPIGGRGLLRACVAILACFLAIGEGVWLTPSIVALHRAGAIRGLGPQGIALNETHKLAELVGKAQVFLVLFAFVMVVVKVATSAHNVHKPEAHSKNIGETPDVTA